jgi:hypothetical protein
MRGKATGELCRSCVLQRLWALCEAGKDSLANVSLRPIPDRIDLVVPLDLLNAGFSWSSSPPATIINACAFGCASD